MKDKTKKRIKRTAVVLIVLGVLYGLAVGIGLIRLYTVYHDLRHDGRPMTVEEVIPSPVADHENGALLYSSAIARLKAEPLADDSLLEHLKTLIKSIQDDDPNEVEMAQQALDQWLGSDLWKEVLALVKQGTQRSLCNFDLDYDDGFDIQMSHLQGLRTITQLMARQVQRLASQAQYDQAWQLTETMGRFADASVDEPLLVNQLVRMAQINATLEAIQLLSQTSPPSQTQVATLNTLFTSFASKEPLAKALDGERLICDASFFCAADRSRTLQLLDMDGTIERFLFTAYTSLGKPLFLQDHAFYLRVMRSVSDSFEKRYSSLSEEERNVTEHMPDYCLMSRMIVPAFYRIFELHSNMLAHLRITNTGLGLIEYFRANKTYPDTLEAWSKETVEDPFTGVPLVYRKESNGFLLYSLGINKEDDYGQVDAKDKRKGDIVWQYGQSE